MRVDLFDYDLPPEAIAQTPLDRRDASRLLVMDRSRGELSHHRFADLPSLLRSGDLLVANDSRVIPARLYGLREGTSGPPIEVFLLRAIGPDRWEVLVKPGRRVRIGTRIVFGRGRLTAAIVGGTDFGGRVAEFSHQEDWGTLLRELGQVPLPPYIHTPLLEAERYQTVYARAEGSVAAPTAGLHFTPAVLEALAPAGIDLQYITLHVGLGTFRPVQAELVEEHRMHAEFYTISGETAAAVNAAREAGRRIVAVGTTSVRALEAAADADGRVQAGSAWTEIFIHPGYDFRIVGAMLTNFHLPRSSLLMLVSAFAGRERVLAAYREALACGYRFFSFGDAMLIL